MPFIIFPVVAIVNSRLLVDFYQNVTNPTSPVTTTKEVKEVKRLVSIKEENVKETIELDFKN